VLAEAMSRRFFFYWDASFIDDEDCDWIGHHGPTIWHPAHLFWWGALHLVWKVKGEKNDSIDGPPETAGD
jgi:hypothetical protein